MKKNLLAIPVIVLCLSLAACGGNGGSGGKKSATSLAQKWCELNGKITKASNDAEKDAAKAALNKWENELEAKYKGDEAFMKEVEKEAEKCEDASEGR